jgi:hypothetical protein
MLSSIFSSEAFRDYAKLPRAERRWHAVVVAILIAVALFCHHIPAAIFGAGGCTDGTLGSTAIASLSGDTQVLFVGSSHVLFGVRPAQYSMPAMNLASAWLDYTCARRLVEKHLRRVPNLAIAVIEYDELPLVSDLVPAMLATRDVRALTELDLAPVEFPTENIGQRVRAMYTDWMFKLESLPRLTPLGWMKKSEVCTPLYHPPKGFSAGYYYTEGVTPPNFDRNAVFVALETAARNERVVQRNLQALQETVALLRSRGVTVVLLRLPHTRAYTSQLPPLVTARWQPVENWARAESSADSGVIIWDRRDDREFEAHDFCDDHHLNVFGADKLAQLLDPGLRQLCRQARNRSKATMRLSQNRELH